MKNSHLIIFRLLVNVLEIFVMYSLYGSISTFTALPQFSFVQFFLLILFVDVCVSFLRGDTHLLALKSISKENHIRLATSRLISSLIVLAMSKILVFCL